VSAQGYAQRLRRGRRPGLAATPTVPSMSQQRFKLWRPPLRAVKLTLRICSSNGLTATSSAANRLGVLPFPKLARPRAKPAQEGHRGTADIGTPLIDYGVNHGGGLDARERGPCRVYPA
jgi:hypothetical protein